MSQRKIAEMMIEQSERETERKGSLKGIIIGMNTTVKRIDYQFFIFCQQFPLRFVCDG